MNDKQLYAQILGISSPWKVTEVKLALDEGRVEVRVGGGPVKLACPECDGACSGYDHRERRWRHLDTCQYETILVADIARVECPEHGVKQINVPWAAKGSRFTLLFEALVIDWLKESSISGAAKNLKLSWDQVDGIVQRAVRRGLRRRELEAPRRIGVDEKSFKKRHDYVTIVTDLDRKCVLYVTEGRKKTALSGFYEQLTADQRSGIEVVAMDMWGPYISATRDAIPGASEKIAFDRFHVVKHLLAGVDRVRREENQSLRREGDDRLVGTKYLWLASPFSMTDKSFASFQAIRKSSLKTSRAWAINDAASMLWTGDRKRTEIRARWRAWLAWVSRSRLAPMIKAGRTVRNHLEGIVNAIAHGVSNAAAEGFNSVVQKLKTRAAGFRNRERFKNAIYFHLGRLDLYPKAADW